MTHGIVRDLRPDGDPGSGFKPDYSASAGIPTGLGSAFVSGALCLDSRRRTLLCIARIR